MAALRPVLIAADRSKHTLAAVLRQELRGHTWSQVRRLIESRRVQLNGELCLDPARRLKEGDIVQLLAQPTLRPRQHEAVVIRYLDEHLVVVEKPSGVSTVRHP